ncbi:effector-associated domain EAD1-containing protein [Ktedonobacter racemifer]|uniref:Effector-associated domain-containing protein n=1 Tax=Ktedonobacter racemifer DSM 44963 TaxID=485913 RepID=D6TH10_KTERA|nr:effector-associated domain EAD1-containing protein [Ktedonobacter racemifer]EFH88939.1 hypothetical protein Krac_10455 [Ktedonobacter racemifer DSM 44963]
MPLLGKQRLSGSQMWQLCTAISAAFDKDSFEETLLYRLNKKMSNIVLEGNFPTRVRKVIERAEQESWTANLVLAVREERPDDVNLFLFAQQFHLACEAPQEQALERTIRETNSDLDVSSWRRKLSQLENQICRVEVCTRQGDTIFGTGFLVRPDLVMTNYHVLKELIEKAIPAQNVRFIFDYKVLEDGTTLYQGTSCSLSKQKWYFDHSVYSELDLKVDSGNGKLPQGDQLDYAIVRLEKAVGNVPIEIEKATPTAPPRGWIQLSTKQYSYQPETALFLLHHPVHNPCEPQFAPLKLTFDTQAILTINANHTRLRYTTNTTGGSSGAPCFNANWDLIALHHAGDPNFQQWYKPTYNQGIPISAIITLLQQKGKTEVLQ